MTWGPYWPPVAEELTHFRKMGYNPLDPNPDLDPNDPRPAFGRDGQREASIGFDFGAIDRDLDGGAFECVKDCPIARDAAANMLKRVLEWVWQRDPQNAQGIEIRAAIACWVFVPMLRPLTMSKVAAYCGNRDKQSLGRWVDEFKRDFPEIKTSHMQL